MRLSGTSATLLYVRDFAAMRTYYRDVLGLPEALEDASDGGYTAGVDWTAFDPEGRGGRSDEIHFFELLDAGVQPDGAQDLGRIAPAVFSIGYDDLEAVSARLQQHDAVAGPIVEAEWGRFIRAVDPEGNELELHEWAPEAKAFVARWSHDNGRGEDASDAAIHRLYSGFNDRAPGAAAAAFATEAVFRFGEQTFVGPDGWISNCSAIVADYPDCRLEVRRVVRDRDTFVVEYDYLEQPGSAPLAVCDVWECADGTILGGRSYTEPPPA